MDGLWRVHFNILDRPVSVEWRKDSKDHLLPTTLIESGPKWTVQKGETRRSLKWTVTRKFYFFGPSIFCVFDRPLTFFKTVQFHPFEASIFIPWNRPDSLPHIVQSFSLDHPISLTVHFESFGPSSLICDRPVSLVWTFQYDPHGPSALTQDRPHWTWPL